MKMFPPEGTKLSLLGAYITYPIGKIMLRILTIGKYPPEERKHNDLFVGLFPWFFFCIVAGLYWG